MLRRLLLALVLILIAPAAFAQNSTTVTINVTDAGGQTWNNGTYTLTFVGPGTATWPGGAIQQVFTGALSGSGSASVSIPSNAVIIPSPTFWNVKVCPNPSVTYGPSGCFTQNNNTIFGSTQTLTLTPPAIVITVPTTASNISPVVAYADAEISGGWVGFTYYNVTLATNRQCTTVNSSGCTAWLSSGSGNAQNTPGTAGPMPQFAAYTFGITGGTTVYARNNSTGAIDFSGTDAAVVIQNAINNVPCSYYYFKLGDYNFNSATQEVSATTLLLSGNLFYSLAIAPNAGSANQYCQYHFEGEAATYVSGTALQSGGTIFDITASAVTAAAPSTNMLVGIWARPDTTNSVGNDVFFKNITVRFPNNTRGNECAICPYEAGTVDYDNVTTTLATPIGTPLSPIISPATAGTNRMIGLGTTKNSHNNWEHFSKTWVIGYDVAYDLESEHVVMDSASALLNVNAGYYGRIAQTGQAIVHPGVWIKVTDQENINGFTLGAGMGQGGEFDIFGYDIEQLGSGAFARVNNLTETNCNYTSGIITYQVVNAGVGVGNNNSLWNAGCGLNFQTSQGNTRVSYQNPIMIDNFAGPNTTLSLAPGWVQFGSGSFKVCDVVSNHVQTHTAGSACGVAFQGQTFNPDQFASVKVTAIDATGAVGPSVRAISTFATVRTMYSYKCSTSGGLFTNRAILKVVANTPTTLVQTAGASGCVANDVMELDVIGSSLFAYYNGVLDLVTTDSALTSGFPGFELIDTTTVAGTGSSNFVGGSLPTKIGADSIYNKPAIHPMYLSSGTAPTPTGTGACATITTQVPSAVGSQAGTLKCTGTTGASTITLTFPAAQAAPNGWRCSADDITTAADRPSQTTPITTTACVLTTTATAQNDVIVWNASPF